MREYLIPYPYTVTIFALIAITLSVVISNYSKINKKRYYSVLFFTFIYGLAQIHGMENLPNVEAWYFPEGSALLSDAGLKIGKIAFEDLLFIPLCASMFYCFMFLIKKVPDYLGKYKFLNTFLLCSFIIVEAMLYQAGGLGARILIVAYTLPAILVITVYVMVKRIKLNLTHFVLSFLFVLFINCGWDFINAYLRHWVYSQECELFSKNGFFLDGRLHISIFFQYAISGFFVMYASWIGFKR